jgi:oxygen-independent coproporphyrinogen-3 oxidase
VSAYALVVEEGTRMAGQVRRGEIPAPDDDDLADRYLLADEVLAAPASSGTRSATGPRRRPAGPAQRGVLARPRLVGRRAGAHSHVGGTRWWNVRHPTAYAGRLAAGASPAHAREVLTPTSAGSSSCCSGSGCATGTRSPTSGRPVGGRWAGGRRRLLDPAAHANGRAALTLRGRLLADAVVRDLVD